MRYTIFRGKTKTNSWIYGNLVYSNNIEPAIYFEVGEGNVKSFGWSYVDEKSIGEYIGVNDKNNKPIYEGDVVSLDHPCWACKSVCIFVDGCFMFKSLDEIDKGAMISAIDVKRQNLKIEVVNNIYDNGL